MNSDFLESGYFITIHKAEGNHCDAARVVVRKSMLMNLTLIYTTLTRATDLVEFVAKVDAGRKNFSIGAAGIKRQVGFINV